MPSILNQDHGPSGPITGHPKRSHPAGESADKAGSLARERRFFRPRDRRRRGLPAKDRLSTRGERPQAPARPQPGREAEILARIFCRPHRPGFCGVQGARFCFIHGQQTQRAVTVNTEVIAGDDFFARL